MRFNAKLMLVRRILIVTLSAVALHSLHDANGQERGQGAVKIKVENGEEIDLYRESHALVIGASAYDKGWPSLPGANRDVLEVADILKQHGFQVETLTDPTPPHSIRPCADSSASTGRPRTTGCYSISPAMGIRSKQWTGVR